MDICPQTISVPRVQLKENCQLPETDNVQGQISSIFSPQMEACVFIILPSLFCNAQSFLKLGNILRYSSVFGHMICSDQLHTGKKILWIIKVLDEPTRRETTVYPPLLPQASGKTKAWQ